MLKTLISRYERGKSKKIKLISLCIKAITGVLGGSMILSEARPYLTLAILSIGAVANEVVSFIEKEELASDNTNSDQSLPQ